MHYKVMCSYTPYFYPVLPSQFLECVQPKERHHPLLSVFTEKFDKNKFEIEFRDFPVSSSFSAILIAKGRTDMRDRTIDCVDGVTSRHSLLRCLSKEIFGTENHYDILISEFSNELLQNITQYRPFIGEDIMKAFKESVGDFTENEDSYEQLAKFIGERIEDDLPCNDLLLWLACTFFQTPIYVLRVHDTNNSTESNWTEYTQLRRKKGEIKKHSLDRKCLKNSKYYICLLKTAEKLYHRIVSKRKVCNCFSRAPKVPDRQPDTTPYRTEQGRNFLIDTS